MDYFNDPSSVEPSTADLIATVNAALAAADKDIQLDATASGSLQEFHATLNVGKIRESLELDLDGLSLDFPGDFDFPSLDIGLQIEQSQPIEFGADLDLGFTFGVASAGSFYVSDPTFTAGLNLGDAPLPIREVDPLTSTFTLAGTHTAGTPDAVTFAPGDRFYVTGSLELPGVYTVATATTGVDEDGAPVTLLTVLEPFEADTAGGVIRKAFDLTATLGPLGIGIQDGLVNFDTEIELGVPGQLSLDTITGDTTGSLLGLPTLGGDTAFELLLPIVPQGVLAELSAGTALVSASSTLIPEDAGLAGFLANLPNTITLSGFEDLFRFKGISLDMILDALEASLDDLVGMDREVVGRINGSQLEVYAERWSPTGSSLLSTEYSAVLNNSQQPTRRVTLEDGSKLHLLQWQRTSDGAVLWGMETGLPSEQKLETYQLSSWSLFDSYDTSDVQATLVTQGSHANTAITGGGSLTLSTYRLQDGLLYDDVPLIGVSAANIFGDQGVSFVEGLHNAVSTVRDTARNIHELDDQLNAALLDYLSFLGLAPETKLISMNYANSTFDFDFDLAAAIQATYDLNLDIDDLNLSGMIGDLADGFTLELNAPLTLDASMGLHLGFGFDLSNVLDPVLYVDQDSGVSASVIGAAPDLDFEMGFNVPNVGTLGLLAIDGSAAIELGFYANLGDPNADLDGDGILDVGEVSGAFQAEAYGSAEIDLPLYFPVRSLPLGLSKDDNNGDGVPDHVLHASAEFSIDQSLALTTQYDYVLPATSMSFDVGSAYWPG